MTTEYDPSFDVHQTDPARLKAEIKKDVGLAKQATWECQDCGREVKSEDKPKQCKCGGYKWKKLN